MKIDAQKLKVAFSSHFNIRRPTYMHTIIVFIYQHVGPR